MGSEKPLESVPGCKKDGSALFSESMKLGLRASFDGRGDFFESILTLPPQVNPFTTAENERVVQKRAHERIFERFKASGQPEPVEQQGSKGQGLSYPAAVRIDWPDRISHQSKP